ncbi:MAG: hypothetical protein EBY22_02540 [Gammaproteobacteria bacterium]|nr:hypothetical protein [Gammaproteobacteria bacterium]
MPPNNTGYNTNSSFKSNEFPNEIRSAVKKGINPKTRRRGIEYLAGIKHGKQVEMPPQAPKFHLGNFAGSAIAELNASNAAAAANKERKTRRAAILQAAKNRGKKAAQDPKFLALPVVNFSNDATNAEIFGESPAENLGNKQNRMAANAELNNLLGGLPLANAPGAGANAAAAKPAGGKRKLEKWVTNDNAKETYYYDPETKESMWNLPSGNVNVVNGNANVAPAPLSPVPQNNTASNNTGTGSVVGKNIKQQINLKAAAKGQAGVTNVGGESIFANNPYNLNFKNRKANNNNNNNTKTGSSKEGLIFGGNIQKQLPLNAALGGQARATNVGGTSIFNTNATAAPAALVGNAPGEVISTNSTFIEGKSVVPDFQVKIRNGSIVAKNGEVTVVATSLEKMPAGFGLGSGGMGMPGMPSMPKFSMPRFSGPKIDLSWLKLPNFGHFKLPETDIKGMLGKFLAALPTISREKIIAALKKGGEYIGLVLISPLLLAAWLYEHGFNLNIKLDGLTGGLISLEDWFLGGNQPAVKEIGRKLKMATDIAKRVVTNTIAEQEFLQKQINDKTRTAESVKQQILASLDSQIANIKTTLANLSADIKQVTVDPEYDNLIDEIDFEGYKGNSTKSANENLMAELNMLLDSIQKAYEGMAMGEEATVAQKNVEKFKQIRKNFDDMLALPQKIRDEIAKTAAPGVGAKLKELGRDARSRTAKLGYNVGQFFSRGATRVASMFGRGKNFTNANRTRKNAYTRNNVKMMNNPIGAGEKKPSFWNRVKGFGSKAASFLTRKKSPNVSPANRGLNAFKSPALRAAMRPGAAAAAYTRKNRRYNH